MKRKVERTEIATNKKQVFESIAKASKDINARNPVPAIVYALQGKQLTAYGYKWKYID